MRRQDGIALITSLLVMAAIMALGVGTMFLSTMNLKIAENSRTHAVARYNAEAGLEAAIVKLKQDYKAVTPNQFPASLTLPGSPDGTVTYRPVGSGSTYTPYTSGVFRTQARVVIVGTGPNNATHQAEALIGAEGSTGTGATDFHHGFVSEGVVRVAGNFTTTNANIHGNAGYNLEGNGTFRECALLTCRNLSVNSGPSTNRDERPVTAEVGLPNYTCSVSGSGLGGLCSGGGPAKKTSKLTVGTPPYVTVRNTAFETTSTTAVAAPPETDVPSSACDYNVTTLSPTSSYASGTTVCVTPSASGLSLADANLSNINIIVKGSAAISGNSTLNNVNILSTGTLNVSGNAVMNTGRLFSNSSLALSGNLSYTGPVTLASGGTLTSQGNLDYRSTGSNIELSMMSLGDMTVSGNSQAGNGGMLKAALWSGANMSLTGNLKLNGGAAAVGSSSAIDLNIEGNAEVDGRGTFTNNDVFSTTGGVVATVSRR